MTNDGKNNNLIQFPTEKRRAAVQAEAGKSATVEAKSPSASLWKFNQKSLNIMVIGFLFVFGVTAVNSNVFEAAPNEARYIASTGDAIQYERNTDWEHNLARNLASLPQREMASIGYRPSVEENLRFGTLEGKYSLQFEAGKLSELNLAPSHHAQLAPTFVNDRSSFLKEAKSLLPAHNTVQSMSSEVVGESTIETYDLLGDDAKAVAEVQFELDLHGRLLSMKVQNLKTR